MTTIHTYHDAFLAPLVTPDREARAIAAVAERGTFPGDWPARLAVLRAYVITCLECAGSPDDLFTAKGKQYRAEWSEALAEARAAAAAATPSTSGGSFFTVPLERA